MHRLPFFYSPAHKGPKTLRGPRFVQICLTFAFGHCYSGCQKFVPLNCHCEELSDEAIFLENLGDCFATLAMTFERLAKSIGTYFLQLL
jgi:hypothetical protein